MRCGYIQRRIFGACRLGVGLGKSRTRQGQNRPDQGYDLMWHPLPLWLFRISFQQVLLQIPCLLNPFGRVAFPFWSGKSLGSNYGYKLQYTIAQHSDNNNN